MCHRRNATIVVTFAAVVALASTVLAQSTAKGICGDPTSSPDRMQVYDIDFGGAPGGATQILVRVIPPGPPGPSLVTASTSIQNLLQVSLVLMHPAAVFFADGKSAGPIPLAVIRDQQLQGEGRIQCLACEAGGTCAVRLLHKGVYVVLTTTTPRAQGILFTAVAHSIPVDPGTLAYTKPGVITRVKINVPSK